MATRSSWSTISVAHRCRLPTYWPNWETTPDNTTTYDVLLTDLAVNALLANIKAIGGDQDLLNRWTYTLDCVGFGTVGAGSTTTNIVCSAIDVSPSIADQLKGKILIFRKGTTTANLRQQGTKITANTTGPALTVETLTTAPVSGDSFVIL